MSSVKEVRLASVLLVTLIGLAHGLHTGLDCSR